MSAVGEALLQVQELDLDLDRLTRTIERPPELEIHDQMRSELSAAVARRQDNTRRTAEAENQVAGVEAETAEIAVSRQRLEGQLRNVVVVREAEALQHEIDQLAQRRDELDDLGLEALTELETLEADRIAIEASVDELESRERDAAAALAEARDHLTSERDDVLRRRDEARRNIDDSLLARYDQLRSRNSGVGVARLEGARCGGCHLDLARSELEELRSAPVEELVECPSCGRLLVR
jgi:predicted  nucleic acid-binding Zn-ribbon protein